MKIKIDTPHYKLYSLSYTLWNRMPPEQTNLCQYVRRLAFMPLSLFIVAFLFTLAHIMIGLRAIVAYPFGYTTDWKSGLLNKRSSGLFQVGSFQFYLGYVLFPIALFALNRFVYTHFPESNAKKLTVSQAIAIMVFVFECVAGIAGVIIGSVVLFTSDTYDLITEYFDAKTEGVCPLVEFEDNDGDQ